MQNGFASTPCCTHVLNKNKGSKTVTTISEVMSGSRIRLRNKNQESIPSLKIACFKFVPIVTVDAERSFSIFRTVLADNRLSYTFENLKKTLVIRCNVETINNFSS